MFGVLRTPPSSSASSMWCSYHLLCFCFEVKQIKQFHSVNMYRTKDYKDCISFQFLLLIQWDSHRFLVQYLFNMTEILFSLATRQRRQPHFPILTNLPTSQSPLWSPDQHNTRCLISAGPSGLPQTEAEQLTWIPVKWIQQKHTCCTRVTNYLLHNLFNNVYCNNFNSQIIQWGPYYFQLPVCLSPERSKVYYPFQNFTVTQIYFNI